MFTILGADGKEYGPVAAERIVEWIKGGRANAQTRARRDGETEWKTLGEFAEFAQTAAETPPPAAAVYQPAGGASAATPAAAPLPALTGTAKEIADDLIARAAPLDIFECLSRSFNLWTSHFWPLVGVTFVIYLITTLLSMIPILGVLVGLLLTNVFYAGLYYYYLGKVRGEPRVFGDAFAGFNRAFGPLVLVSLFTFLVALAAAAVLIGPWVGFMIYTASNSGEPPVWTIAGLVLCSLPLFYLGVAWSFAPILAIDRGLSAWTAMEVSRRVITKQWFRVFFTVLCALIVTALGLLGLIIGVIFTMPILIGAMIYAYEGLCNPPAR